jgi:hypothetical protein
MSVASIFKERFLRGQRPTHNLQFPAGLTLAEVVAGFSNYFWPSGKKLVPTVIRGLLGSGSVEKSPYLSLARDVLASTNQT